MLRLPQLDDACQSPNINYDNAKQQCADMFTKGFTNPEAWKTSLSIVALFDMGYQKVTKQNFGNIVRCSVKEGDDHNAMELRQIVDGKSGVRSQKVPFSGDMWLGPCMCVMRHCHCDAQPTPFTPPKKGLFRTLRQAREREATPCNVAICECLGGQV